MSTFGEQIAVALQRRLGLGRRPEPLADTGLAHWHFVLGGGRLARVPKQSQMQFAAGDNLDYQTACFRAAEPSARTPRLFDVLAPDDGLPMGALIVEHVPGAPLAPTQAGDFGLAVGKLVEALAAIHALDMPVQTAPLLCPADPFGAMLAEVSQQAKFVQQAGVHPDSAALIAEELGAARRDSWSGDGRCLILFDAHPGNFLCEGGDAYAIAVDLEKARYSHPGFDLAHATLYTSLTWDVAASGTLDEAQLVDAYADWIARVDPPVAVRETLLPARRLMALWSFTWCAKWQALNPLSARGAQGRDADSSSSEDWSAELSEPELIAHVRDRVTEYLRPDTVDAVRKDWAPDGPLAALE